MKQLLHLAKKDLTRHWLAALLVVSAIALDGLDTRLGLVSVSRFLPDGWIFILVKWSLSFLFAVAVVQEDNTTGDRSYWRTRPIEPLALLGAKLLSLFAIIVIPQAVSSGLVALSIDAPPRIAAVIAAEALGLTGALCLATVLVAALTRSILHACAWIGALVLAAVIAVNILLVAFPEPMKPSAAAVAAGGPSRVVAALLFSIPSLIAVLCFHFRRRSVPISAAAGVAVLLGIPLIGLRWPWQLIPLPAPAATVASAQEYVPSKISFRQAGEAQTTGFREAFDPALRKFRVSRPVMLPVSVELDRTDRVIEDVSATTTLQFADGTSRTFGAVNSWLFSIRPSAPLAAALGLPPRAKPIREERRRLNLFAFAGNENPIPPDHPANATVKISFEEFEMRLVGRFPLVRGTHFRTDVWQEISEITRGPDSQVRIRVRQLELSSLLQPEQSRPSPRSIRLALYNRNLNEFSTVQFAGSRASDGPGAIRVGTVDYTLSSRVRAAQDEASSDLTAEWLAGAELLVFRAEKIGRTEQTLHIENLFVADRELPVTRLVD